MTQLTIPIAELRRLAGIDATDTSQDAALALLQASEQGAVEYALDPAALTASATDDGLRATLALGVAETLAGSFLGQQARAPGATDGVKVGDLSLSPSGTAGGAALADALSRQGAARLVPFRRPVIVPLAGPSSGQGVAVAPEGPLSAPTTASAFDDACSDVTTDACAPEAP